MLASKDQLIASHEEFRKLAYEHTQYEQRLDSKAISNRRRKARRSALEEAQAAAKRPDAKHRASI
jgi:hypothetical protein